MLQRLKEANILFGRFMPNDLEMLTPKEYENMAIGAQQRIVNQNKHDYAMSKATVPVAFVENNDNDEKIVDNINKQQEILNNVGNSDYQQKKLLENKRNERAASVFDKFLQADSKEKGE